MTNQSRAFVCAGCTILAWSTVSTAFKIALAALTPMQLIFVSMLTASLVLFAVMAAGGRLDEATGMSRGQRVRALGLGLMLYAYYMLLFTAYDHLPAQVAQPINYTWAVMLALLASWRLKQRLSLKEFCCMLLAWSGVAVISLGCGGTLGPLHPLGLACVIASTALYAIYWTCNTESGLPPLAGLAVSFAAAACAAGLTLPLQGGLPECAPRPLAGGVYVGLFELAIPFLLWGRALRLTSSVARISTLPFLVPFLALFWISLVIREPIAWTTLAGLALIVAGTVMQQRLARRRGQAGGR